MKRISTIVLSAILSLACSKTDKPIEYGNVSLNIQQGAHAFIESKSNTKANETIPDTYQVLTTTSADATVDGGTGLYGTIKNGFTIPTGTGYKISAYNCTAQEAVSTPDIWGQQHFFGNSTFNVAAGNTVTVNFTCQMINSKVTVAYDQSFISQFENYSVTAATSAAPSRILSFDNTATVDTPAAFFNVDPTNATLNITISGTRKIGNVLKTYNETTTLLPKTWHKLTIKATSTSGSTDLDITVDNSITEVSSDVNIDPY